MRALLSVRPGGPEWLILQDVPVPAPAEHQVVVRVEACGVNFPDALIIEDLHQNKIPRPFAPGCEIAGVVVACGEMVSRFKKGDRILASLPAAGGMSEQIAISTKFCLPMPDSMSFEHGASILTTYMTSLFALRERGRLQAAETLLVLGASGGVGLAAVQLGKAMGATVVAGVSSQDKLDIALAQGADRGFVYGRDVGDARALRAQMKAVCGPDGAHVIYDAVGGPYAEPALRAIAWEGRYLVVGYTASIPAVPFNLMLLKGCQVIGVFLGASTNRDPELHAALATRVVELYASGAVRPLVSERFPLAQGGKAIALLSDRRAVGKVVVLPNA